MVCEISWYMAITCALEEFENSVGTNLNKSILKQDKQSDFSPVSHRHAMHARVIFLGWVDYLKNCK